MASPPNIPDPKPPSLPTDGELINPTLSWLMEAVQESESFLSAQPGWHKIAKSIEAIMSQDEVNLTDPRSTLSRTRTNRISKIAEDISALMTDTKPFWDYSVANRRFEQHAQIYSKLATFWYQNRNIDLVLGDVIKYYVACGTGYLHLYWDTEIEDINATAEDPRNVLPIRPLNYKSLEDCLGVIVKKKVPVNYIRDRYGVEVRAENDGSATTWLARARDSASDVISPIWKWRNKSTSEPDIPRIPTVTLYTCYIKDNRTNSTGKPKEMGPFRDGFDENGAPTREPSTNWSYLVQPSEKLYPNRRMIVWCGTNILYDGPCFYWHGQFPIIKLTLNPYPWSFLGKGPVWDLLGLQQSLNAILRVIDDHAAQVAQPGAVMDKNNVTESQYQMFDTRRPGWKIRQNPLAGKGVQIINPPPLDASIFDHRDWITREMEELSGITDMARLMDLKQLPENSTVESIMNQMTPGLRLRSRILEAFTRSLAMQLAYNFSQYYTLPMRVAILGPGGITQDDFDFDPGSLVPDFPNPDDYESYVDENGVSQFRITPEAFSRGPLPKWNRTQEFLRRFIFKISPASLLNGAQMERTLIYFQLARAGWLDIITLLEQLNVPNIGVEQLPDNVRTILDRLQWQQQVGLTMAVNPAGRKASGQEQPRVVAKES